jgi:hypothetical protein
VVKVHILIFYNYDRNVDEDNKNSQITFDLVLGCWQVDILVEYGYCRLIIDEKSIGCSMVWLYLFTG